MKKVIILVSVLSLSLAACNKRDEKSAEKMNLSVADNAAATNLLDWEKSANHPEKLFAQWNEQMVRGELAPTDVCQNLLDMKSEDLTIFENEIRELKNGALLKDCKAQLLEKLDKYWKSVTPKPTANDIVLKASSEVRTVRNDFKFPDNVQTRDLEDGYFATVGDVQPKEVILTFDDGPHPEYTLPILESLREVNAKGIFFQVGKQVRLYPELVKAVAKDKHSVGAHSMSHLCLPYSKRCQENNRGRALSVQEAVADIRNSMQLIYNVLGWVDPYFRFPYGESSPDLKKYLRDNQVGEFYWSVDSNDWKTTDKNGQSWTPERMVDGIMNQLNTGKRKGIILMHDVQRKTMVALPELLRRLYNEGYTPVVLVPERDQEKLEPKILQRSAE